MKMIDSVLHHLSSFVLMEQIEMISSAWESVIWVLCSEPDLVEVVGICLVQEIWTESHLVSVILTLEFLVLMCRPSLFLVLVLS